MRRKLPSIQALSCFEAAARYQSFTRAAQELSLTQGAVSRQVATLEAFLEVALFVRTQHGMVLTPAGAAYVKQVRLRLNALERDTVALMGNKGQGVNLILATVPTFGTHWLIPRLPSLAAELPDLVVHLEIRTRPFLFADSGVDAAIWAGTPQQAQSWAGTLTTRFLDEDVLPVCSPKILSNRQAVSAKTLAQMPLLQQATRLEAWRQWFDSQGVEAPRAMVGPRYELFSMQVAAAKSGLGVALVPTLLIQDELRSGALVAACARPLKAQRSYYLVEPQEDNVRPELTLFRQWLLRQ